MPVHVWFELDLLGVFCLLAASSLRRFCGHGRLFPFRLTLGTGVPTQFLMCLMSDAEGYCLGFSLICGMMNLMAHHLGLCHHLQFSVLCFLFLQLICLGFSSAWAHSSWLLAEFCCWSRISIGRLYPFVSVVGVPAYLYLRQVLRRRFGILSVSAVSFKNEESKSGVISIAGV